MKDIKKEAPQAICDLEPANQSTNLIVNRDAPPFDNPEIRRAMALALDRKSFIDILAEGHGDIGGAMQPPPQGVWGMPAEMLKTLPGYGPDIAKNRAEAREIMEKAGYGPDKRLAVKVSVRNTPPFRDPAVILIDQLREIYIDARTRNRRKRQLVSQGLPQGLQDRAKSDRRSESTIPTRNSTKITPAARTAITPATATPKSTSCSISSRWSGTRRSAAGSSGKSTRNCRRTARGRSSSTTASRPAGSRRSRD